LQLGVDLRGRHSGHGPRQPEPAEALELELGLQLDVKLEGDRRPLLPLQVVDVRVSDRLQLFLLLRDAPALLDELAQRLLTDVVGELFSYHGGRRLALPEAGQPGALLIDLRGALHGDRKSTRLNSSLPSISYAVFCLKKKTHLC